MKKFFLTPLLLFPLISFSQITITENDMPSTGEDYIVTNCVPDLTIDLNQTGANQTWDYSGVVPATSSGDTFLSVSSLSLTYFLVFFLSSNLADKSGVNFSINGYGLT